MNVNFSFREVYIISFRSDRGAGFEAGMFKFERPTNEEEQFAIDFMLDFDR